MRKNGEVCKLTQLVIGQKGKVLKLDEENKKIRRHMLDMGITVGVEIEIKKIAPLGDPVDIKLRDYELCIRREDLSKIIVEIL